MRKNGRLLLFALGAGAWMPLPAPAHPAYFTSPQVLIGKDGRYRLFLKVDVLAFALNETSGKTPNEPMDALLSGPRPDLEEALADGERRFKKGFVATTDRGPASMDVLQFPRADQVEEWRKKAKPVLPVVLEIKAEGQLPPETRWVSFQFPRILDQMILQVNRPDQEPYAEPLEPGMPSSRLSLVPDSPRTWPAYVRLGFEHILPKGVDHILFVLGLFLLGTGFRPLLWQVTAFTVAHSITLALSLYDVVRLPASVVEPIIAFSIVFVAVENIVNARLTWRRPLIVFGFGMVHGMGFAGVFQDLGLREGNFLSALIGFNVGVELGQLAVIALAFLAVGWLRNSPRYRAAVVIPGSAAIAGIACYWTVQRVAESF
jgi:hypothetical protein